MKNTTKVLLTSIVVALLFTTCYPLTTGSVKWRVKWDKDLKKGKKAFLDGPHFELPKSQYPE